MADHLVTGLIEVRITCGNLACNKTFDQPGLDPAERLGWIVCPHCITAAPVNVSRDLGTPFDQVRAAEHRRLADAIADQADER